MFRMKSFVTALLCYVTIDQSFSRVDALSSGCQATVKKFIQNQDAQPSTYSLREADIINFVHVPRTGGRTFNSCYLRQSIPEQFICPKSYDIMNFKAHAQKAEFQTCTLLSSHEDFSIVNYYQEELHHRKVGTITQVRNPVDRVLSAYEFAMEISLRGNKSSTPVMNFATPFEAPTPARSHGKNPKNRTKTADVYPWSVLMPWLHKDIENRSSYWSDVQDAIDMESKVIDPYDNDFLMSLEHFIEEPLVKKHIHNGAAKQYAGITYKSVQPDAPGVLKCVLEEDHNMASIKPLVMKRMENMAFIGLTEHLNLNAQLFAALSKKSLKEVLPYPKKHEVKEEEKSEEELLLGFRDEDKHEGHRVSRLGEYNKKRRHHLRHRHRRQLLETVHAPDVIRSDEIIDIKGAVEDENWQAQGEDMTEEMLAKSARFQYQRMHAKSAPGEGPPDVRITARKGVESLGMNYQWCERNNRDKYAKQRNKLFHKFKDDGWSIPVMDKAARANISPKTLKRIAELNQLDMELYEYAKTRWDVQYHMPHDPIEEFEDFDAWYEMKKEKTKIQAEADKKKDERDKMRRIEFEAQKQEQLSHQADVGPMDYTKKASKLQDAHLPQGIFGAVTGNVVPTPRHYFHPPPPPPNPPMDPWKYDVTIPKISDDEEGKVIAIETAPDRRMDHYKLRAGRQRRHERWRAKKEWSLSQMMSNPKMYVGDIPAELEGDLEELKK